MLQQANSEQYWKLLEAGYKPEQIVTCNRGDPCWCEISVASGKGYVKQCGLAYRDRSQLFDAHVQRD